MPLKQAPTKCKECGLRRPEDELAPWADDAFLAVPCWEGGGCPKTKALAAPAPAPVPGSIADRPLAEPIAGARTAAPVWERGKGYGKLMRNGKEGSKNQ